MILAHCVPDGDRVLAAVLAVDLDRQVVGPVGDDPEPQPREAKRAERTPDHDSGFARRLPGRCGGFGEGVDQPVGPPVDWGDDFAVRTSGVAYGGDRQVRKHPCDAAVVRNLASALAKFAVNGDPSSRER